MSYLPSYITYFIVSLLKTRRCVTNLIHKYWYLSIPISGKKPKGLVATLLTYNLGAHWSCQP